MSRRSRNWNESVYQRYIREGRGQGVGLEYKPWLTVRDFPSLGMVSRVKGQITGRVYHLMSSLETSLFYLLDWSENVLDIREQYPLLEIGKAIEIAERAKIRYPYDAKSGFPYVMTCDFYVETANIATAISVKPSSELTKMRVREKLEIERRYWASKGVRWELVTEHEINYVKARNIEWLSQSCDLSNFGLEAERQTMCISFLLSSCTSFTDSFGEIFDALENRFDLSNGMGLNIYKHLVYHKIIALDVDKPIDFSLFGRNVVTTVS